jgi:hypothetical protein
VSSLIDQTRRSGRVLDLFVVDDSRGAEMQAANREVLRERAPSLIGTIHYTDRPARARMAAGLAASLGISEEIPRFALLGDDRLGPSYGASRNTLLLLTAGRMLVMADDDTLFRVGVPPGTQEGLAFTSRHDANAYRYYATEREAMEAVAFGEHDLFALHEKLLGKQLDEIAASGESIDLAGVDAGFAARLSLPGARVGVTYLGTAGDSGMSGHAFRMLEEGESLDRMLVSEATFELGMTTRWIVKAAPKASVSSGAFCMALHIGLDNRQPLPPFMPVMRNEDGVFGSVLAACYPEVFAGYLPAVVPHLPPETRAHLSQNEAAQIRGVRVNDLVSQRIAAAAEASRSSLSMADLGKELTLQASFSPERFMDVMRESAERTSAAIAGYAMRRMQERRGIPTFWGNAVRAYLSSQERVLRSGELCSDWAGEQGDRMKLGQELVDALGECLQSWRGISVADAWFNGGVESIYNHGDHGSTTTTN